MGVVMRGNRSRWRKYPAAVRELGVRVSVVATRIPFMISKEVFTPLMKRLFLFISMEGVSSVPPLHVVDHGG